MKKLADDLLISIYEEKRKREKYIDKEKRKNN
jgi:hypothetical protein